MTLSAASPRGRLLRWVAFSLFGLVTLVLAGAWIANLLIVWPAWLQIAEPGDGALPSTLGAGPFLAWIPQRLLYFLAVDQSTVTTLVALMTAAVICHGLLRLEKTGPLRLRRFPYWPSYQATFVALGLTGTMLGFVIAFRPATVLQQGYDPDVLFGALGTSIWSTLSATVAAYLVGPPVVGVFGALRSRLGVETPESADELSDLERQLAEVTVTLRDLGTMVAQVEGRLANLLERLGVAHLQEVQESLQREYAAITRTLGDVRQKQDEMNAQWTREQLGVLQRVRTLEEFRQRVSTIAASVDGLSSSGDDS